MQTAIIRNCAPDPQCEWCDGEGERVDWRDVDDYETIACHCTKYVDEDADYMEWADR